MRFLHIVPALLAVSLVACGGGSDTSANANPPSEEKAPTTGAATANTVPSTVAEPVKKPEKDLGLTLDEYVRQFNEVSKMLATDVHVAVPEIGEGPVNDGAQIHISPACGVVISLVKGTRKVRSIIFVGRPDDTTDGMTLIALSGVAVHAAFPEAERKAAGNAVGKLFPKLVLDGDPVKTAVGSNEIMASMSKVTGFMVAVSPVE